ncbi:MAG: hypothetical protein HZA49_03565 [Planctomycetes bacterium]|nr:hypothetical protein [Planctomycetota bacterium]
MEPMPMEMTPDQAAAVGGIVALISGVLLLVFLVAYILGSLCVANIAKKLGMSFGLSFIMAIIPIVNYVLMAQMAKKPLWWVILMLIPFVNIIVLILVWMAIAENMGKPSWWGVIIILVPIVNLVFFLMLTFAPAPVAKKA